MNRLKIMPDYECYCVWDLDTLDNLKPDILPISSSLANKIDIWENKYEETYNKENPIESGFISKEDELNFDNEGRVILNCIRKELGDLYDVCYFSIVENKIIDD